MLIRAQDAGSLEPLVGVLGVSEEAQFQLDILKGIAAALKGQRDVPEPKGWAAVAKRLAKIIHFIRLKVVCRTSQSFFPSNLAFAASDKPASRAFLVGRCT